MDGDRLSALRSLIQSVTPAARESYAFSLLEGGFPKKSLIELSGPQGCGKTETILRFLAENPSLRVAWIEERFSAYPCAFPQFGVKLERVLFIEADKNLLWSAHQALRSRLFGIVVVGLQTQQFAEIDLRRLQLAAEQTTTSVILLSRQATQTGAWPIQLQLQVYRTEQGVRYAAIKSRTPRASGVRSVSI